MSSSNARISFARGGQMVAWTVACLVACGGDGVDTDSYENPGPHPVGNATVVATDSARGRELTIELWFPADEAARAQAEQGHPVADFVADSGQRAQYQQLLDSAPAGCPSLRTRSARDAQAATAPSEGWPLVVFSHCHECVRFSSFSIAERLASHGFVVAAPDHAGNTLFDGLAGTGVPLDTDFLQVRAGDVSFVLDVLLDAESVEVPEGLRGRLRADQVGVLGHSFGAVTSGLVVQDDPRVAAALAMASPMENPFLPGVLMSAIDKPVGFLVAVEDNSITEFGNRFMRDNFAASTQVAWKGEVIDAGHWSFSDVAGLHEPFLPGCGQAMRQTDGTDFTYLDVSTANAIVQAYATAFFREHVAGLDGQAYLQGTHAWQDILVDIRDPETE